MLPFKRTNSIGDWKNKIHVMELFDGKQGTQYPSRVCFTIFEKKKFSSWIYKEQELTVSIDFSAREYNGRWYNDLRAWRSAPYNASAQGQAQPMAPGAAPSEPFSAAPVAPVAPCRSCCQWRDSSSAAGNDESSDLPFWRRSLWI